MFSQVHRMTLQAFDLSERTARAGMRSQRLRVARWRSRAFMIAQMSLAAGVAFGLSQLLWRHATPFFATVAAILCLGFSFGQRLGRVIEISIGVAIGVLLGDLFSYFFGTGVWQIVLVVFVALSFTTWLGAPTLMATQAAVQAAAVLTLLPNPEEGLNRWLDALVGCGVALLFALVAPTGPVRRPRLQAAGVLRETSASIRAISSAIRTGNRESAESALERARATEALLDELSEAASEGVAVVRYSPFLRGHRENVQLVADIVGPLDRLTRNLRVLVRRGAVATFRNEQIPTIYLDLLGDLCDIIDFASEELTFRRSPAAARGRLTELAERTSEVPLGSSLSATVMLAQARSLIVDLLELGGLGYADARDLVPDMS